MQTTPLVEISIVIVCLNALAHLQKTLESLAKLPGSMPSIYVVDGASKDGTPAFLAACPYPLAGWLSERDHGIYDAMNKGWNMAADDSFILYLGAGDEVLSLPSRQGVSKSHGDGIDIIIGTCHMGDHPYQSMWYSDLYLNNTAHHQAMMIHKSLCPTSPFDTSFKVYGDWEFNVRLFRQGKAAIWNDDLRSYALPGGVSARHNLYETFRVAARHGGLRNGVHALLRGMKSETRNRLRARREKRVASASNASTGDGDH